MENNSKKTIDVPVWEKANLTTDEAMVYTGIGRDKLREIALQNDRLVIHIGRKVLFKKKKLDEFLERAYYL